MGGNNLGIEIGKKLFNSASNLDADITIETHTLQTLKIDWEHFFPFALDKEEIYVEYVDPSVGLKFIRENYRDIFQGEESNPLFFMDEMDESKASYYQNCGDFFLIRHGSTPIGLFVGSAIDWKSYYMRSCGILPAYRGNGRYQKLFGYLLSVLSSKGVHRAVGDIPPSNYSHIHIFNKFGFRITGFNVSERWGAVVQFTKFLQKNNDDIFLRQFCASEFKKEITIESYRKGERV
jgi:N-acetylglutamate synthase-like GNAT family acetyltransferase